MEGVQKKVGKKKVGGVKLKASRPRRCSEDSERRHTLPQPAPKSSTRNFRELSKASLDDAEALKPVTFAVNIAARAQALHVVLPLFVPNPPSVNRRGVRGVARRVYAPRVLSVRARITCGAATRPVQFALQSRAGTGRLAAMLLFFF